MSVTTAIASYFIVWWLVLFAVLPWGVHSQSEVGEVIDGSDPGAPAIPHLRAKLLWTTAVSAGLFALGALVYIKRWISLDMLRWF